MKFECSPNYKRSSSFQWIFTEHDLSDLVDPHLVILVIEPFESPGSVAELGPKQVLRNYSTRAK